MMIKLYDASLEAFESNGNLIYVAHWTSGQVSAIHQTPDRAAALQWLSDKVFPPTGDFRVRR